MNDNKSRDIFYGVVAIATLIVAIVGATLAYFSLTTGSNNGAVNAKAAKVSINYEEKNVVAQADELIPSAFSIVQYAYESNKSDIDDETISNTNLCLDDLGHQVCSIYRFSIESTDADTDVVAYLNTEYNKFYYLAYALRDASCPYSGQITTAAMESNNCWIVLGQDTQGNDIKFRSLSRCMNDTTGVSACFEENAQTHQRTYFAANSIFGVGSTNNPIQVTLAESTQENPHVYTYDLVIFLNENNDIQDEDQGATYHGNIKVELASGTTGDRVTGTANN